jgi:hypothetical protein
MQDWQERRVRLNPHEFEEAIRNYCKLKKLTPPLPREAHFTIEIEWSYSGHAESPVAHPSALCTFSY